MYEREFRFVPAISKGYRRRPNGAQWPECSIFHRVRAKKSTTMHKNIQSRRCGVRGRDFRPRTTAERRVLDMKISRIKLVAVALTMGLSFSTVALIPANAAATQADVDYSTAISKLSNEFGKAATDWAGAVSNPPTFSFGKKFSTYKANASKKSDLLLVAIGKMKALTPSVGFPKSDALLKKSLTAYELAVGMVKTAINKNDSKLMTKANKAIIAASSSYQSWAGSYADEVKALNG